MKKIYFFQLNIVLHAQLLALVTNYVFQFGNEMLLTSFYASSLLTVIAIVHFESKIEGTVQNLVARCLVKVCPCRFWPVAWHWRFCFRFLSIM